MTRSVLHDAVTLNHFGAADRLDVLESRHAHLDEPRWAEEVRLEVQKGVGQQNPHCQRVLDQDWLGKAYEVPQKDQTALYLLWVGLNDGRRPPEHHQGEAESIFLAEECGGIFLTDDNGAYDFASKRPKLGPGRVIDSVDVLQEAVAMDEISSEVACGISKAIEDAGRSLRRKHHGKLSPGYFE